jgi:hypothetical protein
MKPTLEEMTYQQLVDALSWEVVQDIIKGTSLPTSISHVVQTALYWKSKQDEQKTRTAKTSRARRA